MEDREGRDAQREGWDKAWEGLIGRGAGAPGPGQDDWLEAYSSRLEAAKGGLGLDLGCGLGNDTDWLLERGHRVVACDYSRPALEAVARRHPGLETRCLDLRDELPFGDASASIAIADLSLHYFFLEETRRIVAGISRVLVPKGLLLCRLNSTKDVNHGAGRGLELEPGFFFHEGCYKRFFSRAGIEAVFSKDWIEIAGSEKSMHRYSQEKWLWELALEKPGPSSVCKARNMG